MKVTCVLSTRPDGGVTNNPISNGLIVEFMRYGRPTGTLLWSGDPVPSPTDVMSILDARAAAAAFVASKDVPAGNVNIRVEDGDVINNQTIRWSDNTTLERRFRGCYRRSGTSLPAVDMPLARTQRMNEVRAARTPRLTKSDVDLLKAQEAADAILQTNLKAYRQKLRDLPATEQSSVDACTTPEQLDIWRPTWPTDPAP